MRKSRPIEREFGVPIPGKIRDRSEWTQTAWKKLPESGPLDFAALFGRAAPIVVDLGCGNGRFLLGSALARPDFDHVGIDILPMVLRYATRRGNQRGLGNVRFAAVDAQRFVGHFLAPHSVREIHCYHPQPFHDLRQAARRLLTPAFLAQLVGVLEPGGLFVVQTDNAPYWRYLMRIIAEFFEFREHPGTWPDSPQGRTRREILAMRRGYPIFRGEGTPRAGLTLDAAMQRAAALPLPDFDAGPKRRDLDDLERMER
jgi:tRNA (guanine-N7-)-methyltransferase